MSVRLWILGAGLLLAFSQAQGEDASSARPAERIPAVAERADDAFPQNPFGFFRGHGPLPLLENDRAIGFYFDSGSLFLICVLFLFWVRTSYWVSRDSAILNLHSSLWSTALLLSGLAGFLSAFLLPRHYGLLPLIACHALPLYAYVRLRNSKVPPFSQVLTKRHLMVLALRQLSWLGIRVVSSDFESISETKIRFYGKSDDRTEGVSEAISRQVENSPNYMAAKDLVLRAIQKRASDIHLEPKDGEIAVRFRIDGLMTTDRSLESTQGRNLINIFKILCALDITERRRPQDGGFRAAVDDREIDFRVATQGTQLGEKISIRILDPTNAVSELEELGFRKSLYEQVQDVVRRPHGLILVAGPPGAGKTTTLHAALKSLDAEQRNVITIEDPVEYRLDAATQIEIREADGQTFGESLKNVLRQDPDVVMVGEIRDSETSQAVCRAAQTGRLVFSTVHAQDTIAAALRLLDLGAEPPLLAESLSLLLSQRLVRRLCPDCTTAYKPDETLIREHGLPDDEDLELYRPGQDSKCQGCGGVGYHGLVGVFESLPINEEIRDHLQEKPTPTSLRLLAREHGLLTLREEGLRLVVRGVTSLEELNRVIG